MPYTSDWKPVKDDRPDGSFKCSKCESNNIWYIEWESSDGAHDDIYYKCRKCNHDWWVEGSDY